MSLDRRDSPHRDPIPGDSLADALSPVECGRIQEVLLEYLERSLGPHATLLVREHLRNCPACREEAGGLSSMIERLRAGDPARDAPLVLSERCRKNVTWAWAHPVLAWCVRRHHWVSLAMALLALLAVFAALRHWRMSSPPPEGVPVQVLQKPLAPEGAATGP